MFRAHGIEGTKGEKWGREREGERERDIEREGERERVQTTMGLIKTQLH